MNRRLGVVIAACLCLLFALRAQAVLTIKITQGVEGAQPIAIVPFAWTSAQPPPADIASIISADLARSGRFAPLAAGDLPGTPSSQAEVNFKDWRIIGTPNIVIGKLEPQGEDGYTVEFSLLDVFRGASLTGARYPVKGKDLRRVAHQISDIVFEKLTGERGAFDTRIAYITEREGASGASTYVLNIADSDGFGEQPILRSEQPILSPAWSPDGTRLAYVSFQGGRPRLYIQELVSGQQRKLTAFPGLNSAPAWSPDGKRLAITLSKDGNPEIYVMELNDQRLQRLTNSAAIDTEPAWAPDGRSLVFTSDRGGKPQIYRVPAVGGRAERVTFEGEYNARATFSPDGKQLAFVHGVDGAYRIAVLDFESQSIRVLTDTRLDESPSFAPNGNLILYATQDAEGPALAAVSTDGRVRQRLGLRGSAVREPSWAPFR